MTFSIRRIKASDEAQWRRHWEGYLRFYQEDLSETITAHTWRRILDANSPVQAIVAVNDAQDLIGFANYLLHEDTWELSPACYLEDLFVDPDQRAVGVGQGLIDWLLAEARKQGWSQLYWHTKENNYRARGLYDKYTPHSGFVRYSLRLPRTELQQTAVARLESQHCPDLQGPNWR